MLARIKLRVLSFLQNYEPYKDGISKNEMPSLQEISGATETGIFLCTLRIEDNSKVEQSERAFIRLIVGALQKCSMNFSEFPERSQLGLCGIEALKIQEKEKPP